MRSGRGLKLLACAILCLSWLQQLLADDRWTFVTRSAIGGSPQAGVFHHLEGAGRKHVALSLNDVGVAWEDNSSGDPQVYLAIKRSDENGFSKALRISTGSEAYEPAIAAAGEPGFIIVYEQDSTVFARLWSPQGLSLPQRLSAEDVSSAGHASIAVEDGRLIAVWRERKQRQYRLRVVRLVIENNEIRPGPAVSVEPGWLNTPLLMPTLILQQQVVTLAWEDRRAGHTRLLTSHSPWPELAFSDPVSLNEFYSNRNEYDKGNGVTRVAMAPFAEDEVVAAWMDKRRGGTGYGIFAALGYEGGAAFGPNERVHGAEGDELPHYNPAVAGHADGAFAVVWDDYRGGTLDIWLSTYTEDGEWSEDYAPPPASGEGEQSHPSIAFDGEGSVHMVWIERADPLAPTRLWYGVGMAGDGH